MSKVLYITGIIVCSLYIYGLLSKMFFGKKASSNIKKNKNGKTIEFKDADFEEID
tara:strand:- start:2144 stop:2308 length:165 start_codon:yes stop_codon:yes gene_type:complete